MFKPRILLGLFRDCSRVALRGGIRFRLATLAWAEFAISQIARELGRPQGADSLLKLMTAARRVQDIGMAALSRPDEELEDRATMGTDDWTLMREVRRGQG